VFAAVLFGHPMSLVFNPFEITGITLAVLIVATESLDGEPNWFEELQLVAVYLVLGIVFYFVPARQPLSGERLRVRSSRFRVQQRFPEGLERRL